MSTKIKLYLMVGLLFMTRATSYSQNTIEIPTTNGTFVPSPVQGPVTTSQGPIAFKKDVSNNNNFNGASTTLSGPELTNVTFSISNQQYNGGMPYSNIQTGLVFGAQPTTATGGVTQQVDPGNVFDNLGSFIVSPGGPTDNFYTVSSGYPVGTGIVTGASFSSAEPNGAVFLFTNAQWQYDQPGGPTVHNSSTRYYYGDVVINFNRFITNPVIHIAGLGGSYRYLPVGATNVPGNYLSTFFSTELDIVGYTGTKLSGNTYLSVSGSSITNNAAVPNGASVSTTTFFDEIGAASGSIRINAAVKTITLKVYLRGCTTSNFAWSALGSLSGGSRNPLTGDIWGISVSAELSQLITLPATGLNLTAALNGNDVQLKWKTVSEANSDKFIIERSTDGTNYTQIGVKQAAGYSTTESNYSHVDPNMTDNARYYRVKLVDLDGKSSYSNVAIVRKSGGIKGMKIFPNPVVNQLNLEFTNMKGNHTVSLYNINGQEVVRQVINVSGTVQYFTLVKNSLPAGSYIIKVKSDDNQETYSEKVIFQ